jgi:N-ethylmaleimide reductase
MIEVFGAGRVGVKLSPVGRWKDMYDNDPKTTFSVLAKALSERNIAYI